MDTPEQNVEGKIPGIDDDLPELPVPSELDSLKAKADLMGLSYHPSIGVDKLREKVRAAIEGEQPVEDARAKIEEAPVPLQKLQPAMPVQAYQMGSNIPRPSEASFPVKYVNPKDHANAESLPVPGESVGQKRLRLKRHANELIRIRVTCMNPAKKEWEGEIIAGGNNLVGTLSKYIPFGAEEGWHVPRIIYNVLRDRMAQIFVTTTDPRTKQKVRTGKLIREFNIEVLDPLSVEELKELAERQAVTRAID